MQFEKANSFLMQKLEQELPTNLTYHTAAHTQFVVESAQLLAAEEGITGENLAILQTAALFHDAGFLEGYANHEELSCKIARRVLPDFDYTDDQAEQICKLIMVTKLPQQPTNVLESILCDADLHYLGTDRYFQTAENLFIEFKQMGFIKTWEEWRQKQIEFLEAHQFFTSKATEKYAAKKMHNLLLFKSKGSTHKWNNRSYNRINLFHDLFYLLLGIMIAGFALKSFLVPNHFFDGGVTGISLLVHEIYDYDLSFIILVLNLPFILLSFFVVSRRFAYKTVAAVVLLGVCLLYFPYPTITSDKLLVAFFGGFFLGVGSGMIIRAGCALDGIEVLALYTGKKTSFTTTEITLAFNIVIFLIAAFKFGMETSLYSILTYFTASRTIDYVVEGVEAYTGVTIVSGNSEIIKNRLVTELKKSITIYKGERGYLPGHVETSSDCDIIFTIVSRLELRKLKNLIAETDPNAFVFANTIKEASGGIIARRHAH